MAKKIIKRLSYRDAGVDIDTKGQFTTDIYSKMRTTFSPRVIENPDGFGGLFALNSRLKKYRQPVLVSSTDGVGTKLKIAFMTGKHDTIGIDLVAMCVNDIIVLGAEPLFLLDYLASSKIVPKVLHEVLDGIVEGCRQAGCALIGGETPEMPGFYPEGEYDLAGFAVGVVDKDKIINGSAINVGDVLIGLASSGLHSNGYSLARKLFFDIKKMDASAYIPELGTSIGEELLKPTKIYVRAFNSIRDKIKVKGMAHITGGGISGNLPRIFPEGVSAVINERSWCPPPIFHIIKEMGNVPLDDMRMTFNMGIGYIIAISEAETKNAISILNAAGVDSFVIGNIEKGGHGVRYA